MSDQRNESVLLACAVLILLAVGACSSSPPTPTKQASKFPTTPITLTVWDTAEQTKLNLMNKTIIPAYEQLHPNVTVQYEQFPTNALETKDFVTLANGTAADVLTFPGYDLPVVYPKNLLAPAEDQDFSGGVQGIMSSYLPGLLGPLTYQGHLYGLPIQMNSYSLAENNDMFSAAGLDPVKDAPKTWSDLARLNKMLTKTDANGHVVQKGFDFRYTVGGHWLTDFFDELEYQYGGKILDASGKPVFNDSYGVKAMQTIVDVSSAYTQVSHNTSASPYQDFASAQDAMALGGPNMGAFVNLLNPNIVGHYTFVASPQVNPSSPVTYSYSFDMTVNGSASPDVKRVAWDFVNYALTNSSQWFRATQMLQPHNDWYKQSPAKDIQGIDVFVHDLVISRPAPLTPYYLQLQSIIATAIQQVVLNHQPIQASLDAAVQQFNLAINQA